MHVRRLFQAPCLDSLTTGLYSYIFFPSLLTSANCILFTVMHKIVFILVLAEDAIKAALQDYKIKQGNEPPGSKEEKKASRN